MKVSSVVAVSMMMAMLLSLVFLPPWLLWAWPEWTLLILIYWTLVLPERYGITFAIMVGLFQDSITASLLGKHVLAYGVVVVLTLFIYQKLRMYDLWQQAVVVFLMLSIGNLIEHWINTITWNNHFSPLIFIPSVIGALIWPWISIFLHGIHRQISLNQQST